MPATKGDLAHVCSQTQETLWLEKLYLHGEDGIETEEGARKKSREWTHLGGSAARTGKQPSGCHCLSRRRRTACICGWKAPHSFQCRKSPGSRRYWYPR